MTSIISENNNNNVLSQHDVGDDSNEVVRKRYESMSLDEMTQHMAESYRQLSEVLGNRISLPSALSSSSSTDDTTTMSESTFDVPDDDDDDDELRLVDRNDLDEETKHTKMNKLFSRAVSSGDTERVTHLLQDDKLSKYIDVNAKDEDGATPLIYAACFGKVEISQALLEAGAKTNVQDSSGWSALMWATTNKHESIVKVLMDHGASAQTRSAKGRTVFDFVNSSNSTGKIAEILATTPRDSLSSTASLGDCDFYYQSTVEGYDSFMVEEEERRKKLLETAMALVGGDPSLLDDMAAADDDDDDDNDYQYKFQYATNQDEEDDDDDDDDDDDEIEAMSAEFHWDKCLPDQMFVFGADDLPYILDTMITKIKFPMETQQEICVPANVVFLSARFAHYFSSAELAEQVLEGALDRMNKVTKDNARNIHALAFWMSNQVQLLYYLKQDSGLVVATAEYQLRLSEMISETYTLLIADMEHKLGQVLSKAILDYEQIGGMEHLDFTDDWQRFFRRRNRQSSIVQPDAVAAAAAQAQAQAQAQATQATQAATTTATTATTAIPTSSTMRRCASSPAASDSELVSPHAVTRLLSTAFYALQTYEVHPTIIIQVLAQCMHFMSCKLFNHILSTKKLLSRSKALQIRMNLSYVEDWVRHQQLPSSLLSYLCPTIQLLQLLQCLSQLDDFESFSQTLQKFDQLNAIQIKRCIVNYRYEVNEPKIPEAIERYVIQTALDAVRYKQQQQQKRRNSIRISQSTVLARSRSLSMQRSLSRRESMSSFVAPFIALATSLPPSPTYENTPMPTKAGVQDGQDEDEDNEDEDEDEDAISETRDAKFMLPFSVPTTAHMVSIKGWAPNNGKERHVTPVVPDHWMDKLDKEKYADNTL